MRSTLALLLLFGPAIVASAPCQLYTLPTTGECTIDIEWRVHDNKQALATCLEYFPTTFVTGVQSGNIVKCTVKAAYTCVDANHFLMYDKCYYFSPTPSTINKQKISEYVKMDATTKRSAQCAGGKLAAVYSSTHAKFLGMEANRRGIDKLGIGMTTDGMTIDEENGKKSMLHQNMWKLIQGDYWNGDKLVKLEKGDKPDYVYPATANYLFMRTQTDHIYNRIQGSFERATADVEVTFACEVPAIFTDQQSWYCDKMGSHGLGLDTVYYEGGRAKSARCLYLTAGKYTFEGTHADMANIKGCQERPSSLHSTGMDDGAADNAKYGQFKFSGKLRLAGYKDGRKLDYHPDAGFVTQRPCEAQIDVRQQDKYNRLHEQWKFLQHNGHVQHSSWTGIYWETGYPRNECTDFPGESSTVGLKKGKFIDLPRQVRARAVCSIIFFQECENRMAVEKKSPCGDKKTPLDQLPMFECKSTKTFQPATKGFFTCDCPEQHQKIGDECKWIAANDKFGCWIRFGADHRTLRIGVHEERNLAGSGQDPKSIPGFTPERDTWNDLADRAVVRDGCRLTVYGAALKFDYQFTLLEDVAYGTYHVSNFKDGSLAGANEGMGASAANCQCPKL